MKPDTPNITAADAVLVERCRQGNFKAMEALILKYQGRIYNFILKMCANCDAAAELTRQAFVKAIDNINEFESRSSFYTWLFRIAVNLAINHCQRYIKHGFVSLNNEGHYKAKATLKKLLNDEKSPDPAVIAQNKELCEIVAKLLLKLDAGQRAVILLRDVEGMNYGQIASVLNINPGTVKSRISRARSTLREILDVLLCNSTDEELKYPSAAK